MLYHSMFLYSCVLESPVLEIREYICRNNSFQCLSLLGNQFLKKFAHQLFIEIAMVQMSKNWFICWNIRTQLHLRGSVGFDLWWSWCSHGRCFRVKIVFFFNYFILLVMVNFFIYGQIWDLCNSCELRVFW